MEKQDFIKKIAGYVQKYAAAHGIAVHSPIIAQAVLEHTMYTKLNSNSQRTAQSASQMLGLEAMQYLAQPQK